jgi:hypothetical protein
VTPHLTCGSAWTPRFESSRSWSAELSGRLAPFRASPIYRARGLEQIDGRRTIRAHGTSAMPVWGEVFEQSFVDTRNKRRATLNRVVALTRTCCACPSTTSGCRVRRADVKTVAPSSALFQRQPRGGCREPSPQYAELVELGRSDVHASRTDIERFFAPPAGGR